MLKQYSKSIPFNKVFDFSISSPSYDVEVALLSQSENEGIIEGFNALHLNRIHGYVDVIMFLLWKEIERRTFRYQGNEAASSEINPGVTSYLLMYEISTTHA